MPFMLLAPFDDPDLFAAVTGLDAGALTPARLVGGAPGALAEVADGSAFDRLRFYAAVHGADAGQGRAQAGQGTPVAVQVIALPRAELAGQTFDGRLTPRWCAIWREAADEVVGNIGRQDSAQVQARLRMIWARAEARLRGRAEARVPLGGLHGRNVRLHGTSRPYGNYFALEEYTLSHDRFDGSGSDAITRACFIGADAVTVLPYDPARDAVLVVEQLRAGAIGRSDPSPWLLEPVAGRIEPGDTPEQTARKETREEAGLELDALHPISAYYPTPGAFSEFLYSYVGLADLPDSAAGLGGLLSEAEDIRAHVMPRPALMDLIAEGRAPVGTLQLSAFWLALNLERLRAAG